MERSPPAAEIPLKHDTFIDAAVVLGVSQSSPSNTELVRLAFPMLMGAGGTPSPLVVEEIHALRYRLKYEDWAETALLLLLLSGVLIAGGRDRPPRGGTPPAIWDVVLGVNSGVVQGVPLVEVHGDVALEMHLGIEAGVGGRRFILLFNLK